MPALSGIAAALLPAADLFMAAMLSRPPQGSLRRAWVTPATLGLTACLFALGTPLGIAAAVLAARGGGWIEAAAGAILLAVALGAGAVAAVGVGQRRPPRRR